MSAWYDEENTITKDRHDDARELFEAQAGAGQMIHRPSQAPATSEDLAMLQAAQFAGPRDTAAMLKEARRIGQMMGQTAFYSFPAGGGRVEGPTIDLAYALAQVWGRCRTQVVIDEVDGDRIKLRGRYIDLLTVAITERDYVFHLAPAPGKFANKPDQVERWRAMQEQAAASKAVRGAILGGLPSWFTDAAFIAAKERVNQEATGGEPLHVVREKTIQAFGSKLPQGALSQAELEQVVGRPVPMWVADDITMLRQLFAGLKDGSMAIQQVKADLAGEQAAPSKKSGNGKPDAKPTKPAPAAPPADARLGSLGLGAPAVAPGLAPAAPEAPADLPRDPTDEKPAPAPLDPAKAAQIAAIEELERRAGGKAMRRAQNAVGLSPNPRLKQTGQPKLDAYQQALQAEIDESELMGGAE